MRAGARERRARCETGAVTTMLTDRKAEAIERMKRYEELEALAGTPTIDLEKLPPEAQEEAKQILAELEALVAANPLHAFKPHEPNREGKRPQLEFLAADTPKVAAFCGNQFGKSTVLMVKALIQLLSKHDVPDHLQPFKVIDAPCHGWVLCPTEDKIFDSLLPVIDKWCPKHALKGGSRAKAFNGERMMLTLANGSTLAFKTYKQDASTLGGATLHFIGFDEPPPRAHRDEAATRLLMHGPREWYAMTPLRTNTGWIRREVWRNREAPNVTVVKGSVHDNTKLNAEGVAELMASYASDVWRRAREFGDFMDNAGLVYSEFESRRVNPWPLQRTRALEHVWAIDPGIRNAAIICGGFERELLAIYAERLIQNGTPSEYAEAIHEERKRLGIPLDAIAIVIDPAARQRSQATGDTVQTELSRVGIHTVTGQRDREAGQQQVRQRLQHERMVIFNSLTGLADEADEFAWSMDDDETDSGPADDSPYHRLAALRYLAMFRPWYPEVERRAAQRNLGWQPGQAVPATILRPPVIYPPMGSLS